ncbi:MAG: PDZ domain-containing protein [Acidobacteria bacterium]|nr:MAG: PDZ domain-containing protein [Acidobacteriota bacterium]
MCLCHDRGNALMKRTAILTTTLLALACTAVGFVQRTTSDLRQQTFELVWRRVKEKHYDPQLNGVDWDAIHEKYAPLVAAARSDDEFYALLNQMLGELHQSHFAVIPPSVTIDEDAEAGASETPPSEARSDRRADHDAEVGLTVQWVEDQPVITRVEERSPAARAGLRPGFVVTHIDGEPVNELWEKLALRKVRPVERRSLFMRRIDRRLRGPAGSTVGISYLDERDRPHTVTLKRQRSDGRPVKFGQLPVIFTKIEARRLAHGIGYLRFNAFMMPLLEEIRRAIRSFHDAPGIIIDLRGNPGGLGSMATAVARLFYEKRTLLGTMKLRRGEIRFAVFPAPDAYSGPVVILTDEGTASTSEILAGGMQETGRAIVVGRPSLGAVLPSVIEKLPTGARLQYAIADFKTPGGLLLEGRGVYPDVPVELTRHDLLTQSDPILERAISVIVHRRPARKASAAGDQSH